jgi:hypothetical protein
MYARYGVLTEVANIQTLLKNLSPLSLGSNCKQNIQEASKKWLVYFSSEKKEATSSAETPVNSYWITWCHIPETNTPECICYVHNVCGY